MIPRRSLRLSLPFTILTGPDLVRLVAGEDFRCTLTAPGLQLWLPGLLSALDGRRTVGELLTTLALERRGQAGDLIDRLYSERFLVDALAEDQHTARLCALQIDGEGELADSLREIASAEADGPSRVTVLCQDRLDYEAALVWNRRCRANREPALWASTGAMQRGYVGPLLLPDAGPCLACLFAHFRRLSPAPELYDHLADHSRRGQPLAPGPFPADGVAILRHLILWKRTLLAEVETPAALYRLHVLETATLEVSARRVPADSECPECSVYR